MFPISFVKKSDTSFSFFFGLVREESEMKYQHSDSEELYELSDICCCVVRSRGGISNDDTPIAYYLFDDFDDEAGHSLHHRRSSCDEDDDVRTLYIEYYFDYI